MHSHFVGLSYRGSFVFVLSLTFFFDLFNMKDWLPSARKKLLAFRLCSVMLDAVIGVCDNF